MQLTQFERLETKIQTVIDEYTTARKKNDELLEIIAQKDGDILRLKQELEEVLEERKSIGERVDSMLEKIDNLG